MNISLNTENDIERIYRELSDYSEINNDFAELYQNIEHEQLKEALGILHTRLISAFRVMNQKLPTSVICTEYGTDTHRDLINAIHSTTRLCEALKDSEVAFEIEPYYHDLMERCNKFQRSSRGTILPFHMAKVNLYLQNSNFYCFGYSKNG
jgi:serine/threonine-protein kinase